MAYRRTYRLLTSGNETGPIRISGVNLCPARRLVKILMSPRHKPRP